MKGYSCAYESLSGYIKLWRWPGRIHANHLHELFSEGRPKKHRKAHQIKCQASDMLSLIGVIAVFALQVLLPLNLASNCVGSIAKFHGGRLALIEPAIPF